MPCVERVPVTGEFTLAGDKVKWLRYFPDNHFYALVSAGPRLQEVPTSANLAELLKSPDPLWREIMRVLRPGAPIVIMSLSAEYGLLASMARLAGAEIRDCIKLIGEQNAIHQIDVRRYLVKLVMPPFPAIFLDPWCDSCTHAAANQEGHKVIGLR